MNILITGANGQLGKCIEDIIQKENKDSYKYIFCNHDTLDITDRARVKEVLEYFKPNVVINCAAYTNVDAAEKNKDLCFKVNYNGVVNLADVCSAMGAFLIQISTDYVFDGNTNKPYNDSPPFFDNKSLNVYGDSKKEAEMYLDKYHFQESLVIRTSWLYSEYGKNFFTTIANRITNEQPTKVVYDQIGCPTYARDLAEFIVSCVYGLESYTKGSILDEYCGIVNYTNKGTATWFDFAKHIERLISPIYFGKDTDLITPINSMVYRTGDMAHRPSYSVLDTQRASDYGEDIPYWTDSLKKCALAYLRNRK